MTIEDILLQRFPGDSSRTLIFRNHLAHVCNEFIKSGLADRKFSTELLSGSDSKFWACISEALVASHLMKAGLNLEPTHGAGPDFLIVENGWKIWIEVTCPQATGVPSNWGEINVNEVVDFPHKEILLRWTAAIKEKSEKLMGSLSGLVKGYIEKGIVGPEDAYVIAVNGCQLRHGPFSNLFGISQFPFAAEAVFAIGSYQMRINRETLEQAGAEHSHRPEIEKPSGATVPAYTFLDPRFRPISAIWAVDINGASVIGNDDPMALVHNPNAFVSIPPGLLPAHHEYVATPCGSEKLELDRLDGSLKPAD